MSAGPPPFALRDYALLADGERGVLVGPRGEMAWMCFPSWDSPSVFSALLGGAGHYQVTPADDRFVWGGYYEESTLIWNSRWVTTDSVIECREALAFPADPSRAVILRRVRAVEGPARVAVRLDARADYGRRPMADVGRDGASGTPTSGPVHLRWRPGPGARPLRGGELSLRLDLAAGEHRDLVLELSTEPITAEIAPADELWRATEDSWRHAVPAMEQHPRPDATPPTPTPFCGAHHRRAGRWSPPPPCRCPSGPRPAGTTTTATPGSATSASPARPPPPSPAARSCSTLRCVSSPNGCWPTGPTSSPPTGPAADRCPTRTNCPTCPATPAGKVKAGNRVNRQFQLDGLGEALLLLAAAARPGPARPRPLEGGRDWRRTRIGARWQEPDNGIWELDRRWWTHSRLTCVAGLRNIARTHDRRPSRTVDRPGRRHRAPRRPAPACTRPAGGSGRPTTTGSTPPCSSPSIRGGIAADDPRTTATLAAVEEELCQDGYIYRYRHDDRPLQEAEGAFSLCGFVLALAYLQQGRHDRAGAWFERNRASCGPPGLLTEEFDVGERQLRGNIPQAFVHAMLLECAARLENP